MTHPSPPPIDSYVPVDVGSVLGERFRRSVEEGSTLEPAGIGGR